MSRFQSYRSPDLSIIDGEALAVGFGLGAALGILFPFLAIYAEVGLGTPFVEVFARPSAPLVITMLTPLGTGIGMALAYHQAMVWRRAYLSVSAKASQLMEENWELCATEFEATIEADQGPGDGVRASAEVTPEGETADILTDDLVQAQMQVLGSVGEATQDVARRMHINIRGLTMTELDPVQGRMVDALAGHVEGLWDLADDVVGYSDETCADALTPTPAPRRQDLRSAKPARPPGRLGR